MPAVPLNPAFFAFMACLSLGRKHTNNVTIAYHLVCTCQCTLQCHTETWSLDGCYDGMPCVSAAVLIAIWPENTCLRLTFVHCREHANDV